MLKYGISMGFRIVFFPIAVFFLDGWVRIAAMIIVLLLPWIAVVIANAGRETTPHSEDLIDTPSPDTQSGQPVVRGEIVDGSQKGARGNGGKS
ncbi:hypothetical protein GCM10027344_32460 [Spelaeicoccus albus]